MTLTERIKTDKEPPPPSRVPEWRKRMERDGLPPKDMTRQAAA